MREVDEETDERDDIISSATREQSARLHESVRERKAKRVLHARLPTGGRSRLWLRDIWKQARKKGEAKGIFLSGRGGAHLDPVDDAGGPFGDLDDAGIRIIRVIRIRIRRHLLLLLLHRVVRNVLRRRRRRRRRLRRRRRRRRRGDNIRRRPRSEG